MSDILDVLYYIYTTKKRLFNFLKCKRTLKLVLIYKVVFQHMVNFSNEFSGEEK